MSVTAVVHVGNVLDILPTLEAGSVNCVVTSPPYWGLRDYGVDGQLGLEATPEEYVANMVAVFREVRRVLRDDGTMWLNLGDSYASSGAVDSRSDNTTGNGGPIPRGEKRTAPTAPGLKPKDLCGIPWRVAFALQADGWYLRSDIIWSKPNAMPESVADRCTSSHEHVFMLTTRARYYYDAVVIAEPSGRRLATRNKRDVWTIATQPYKGAHFATFPEKLVKPCVLAGCPVGGTVLDPFTGSGTTGAVACRLGRNFVGVELSPDYAEMAERRIAQATAQLQIAVSV